MNGIESRGTNTIILGGCDYAVNNFKICSQHVTASSQNQKEIPLILEPELFEFFSELLLSRSGENILSALLCHVIEYETNRPLECTPTFCRLTHRRSPILTTK
jgi:hypothetical protein